MIEEAIGQAWQQQRWTAAELLPHRPPVRLITEVLEVSDDGASGQAIIDSACSFVNEQGLPWWASIELMAQTIGLWAGTRSRMQGIEPRLGFLLGSRKLDCNFEYLPTTQAVQCSARLNVLSAEGLAVFDCELRAADAFASARLNVFQPDNVEEYLKEA